MEDTLRNSAWKEDHEVEDR